MFIPLTEMDTYGVFMEYYLKKKLMLLLELLITKVKTTKISGSMVNITFLIKTELDIFLLFLKIGKIFLHILKYRIRALIWYVN